MGPWCTQEMSTLLQVAPPPSSPPPTTPSLPSLPSFGGLGVKCIASNNKQCKFPFKFRRKVSTRILWEFVGTTRSLEDLWALSTEISFSSWNSIQGVRLVHKRLRPREPALVCHRPQRQGRAGVDVNIRSVDNSLPSLSDWVCLLPLLLPSGHLDHSVPPYRLPIIK